MVVKNPDIFFQTVQKKVRKWKQSPIQDLRLHGHKIGVKIRERPYFVIVVKNLGTQLLIALKKIKNTLKIKNTKARKSNRKNLHALLVGNKVILLLTVPHENHDNKINIVIFLQNHVICVNLQIISQTNVQKRTKK